MSYSYIETGGFLYLKKSDKNELENDKYTKLWYLSKLKDEEKFNTSKSHNILEKIINKNRFKLEYPDSKDPNISFSLW